MDINVLDNQPILVDIFLQSSVEGYNTLPNKTFFFTLENRDHKCCQIKMI